MGFFVQYFRGLRKMDPVVLDALRLNHDPFPVDFLKLDLVKPYRTHWWLLGTSALVIAINAGALIVPPRQREEDDDIPYSFSQSSEETSGLLHVNASPPNGMPSSPEGPLSPVPTADRV
eukprot:Protomagalhaensia_sp_Gyna_25__1825@NODE_1965_length_1378_cov_33_772965_g1619_i0_p1_GENE_NODE_1965_length_1378_cov_33_772965_g1619_i0NODE_1965_length_1378_cov_33_772965_g1619_i0_p1_ORF_typecomplete_len119_score22_94_NODE_1965_length_1378_cov_33_772965_g1619_i0591947